MRRITLTSDVFVMLGILAMILGHFRYTRPASPKPKARSTSGGKTNGAAIPVLATAILAGTALLASVRRSAT